MPSIHNPHVRRAAFFPGSTIGNFYPNEAVRFLARIAATVGSGGGLLIGVDLKKDPAILDLAYNDPAGVTAAFNLNMLAHINRELGADFQIEQFKHHAFYDESAGRIEMHLHSLKDQTVHLAGDEILFQAGESILTEVSYKYTMSEFERLATQAGFQVRQVWMDDQQFFSVSYLILLREFARSRRLTNFQQDREIGRAKRTKIRQRIAKCSNVSRASTVIEISESCEVSE